jgi:hypothetical protein
LLAALAEVKTPHAEEVTEKLKSLSFRGTLRAEEYLFSGV